MPASGKNTLSGFEIATSRPAATTISLRGGMSPHPEDPRQLLGRRLLELRVRALARRLVGPPPLERRRVAEPRALQVVVRDLADELDAQRLPAQILAVVPAALRARHAL